MPYLVVPLVRTVKFVVWPANVDLVIPMFLDQYDALRCLHPDKFYVGSRRTARSPVTLTQNWPFAVMS